VKILEAMQAVPAFSRLDRLDRLLPIWPRAEGGPALHLYENLRKLTLSIKAACRCGAQSIIKTWGPFPTKI